MRLSRLSNITVLSVLLLLVTVAQAAAPNFSERVYGDGVAWGTKGTTALPAPNEYNRQAFDACT